MTEYEIENYFEYHAPSEANVVSYNIIREAGKNLALTIHDQCPGSADTTAAIRKVREAVWTANSAIAHFKRME